MATSALAMVPFDKTKPSSILHSIFMTTVNTASNTLLQVASNTTSRRGEKWKASDHFRYMRMLSIWMTVWVLRVLIDHVPCSVIPSPPAILDGFVSGMAALPSSRSSSSLSLVLHHQGDGSGFEGPSSNAIGRALSHIFALINEIPATSRKYQFAVAMADRIVDENVHGGHEALQEINRTALSAAFHRTTGLLYNSLHSMQVRHQQYRPTDAAATWPSRLLHALPLGSYLFSYFRGIGVCVGSIFSSPNDTWRSGKQLAAAGEEECVFPEKLAQELMWMMGKMRFCSAVEEAVLQWSSASGLAALSLSASPRVQGPIVKITAILFRELAQGDFEAYNSRQVKFHMLMLWLPLFCYAGNGLSFPVLSGYERAEMERVMDDLIMSLPPADQEVILNNWLQDYTISSSDWPNLQRCYETWCRSSRKLL